MNEPEKLPPPSFLDLFRYWLAMGIVLALTPFFLALNYGLLAKSSWAVSSVVVGVLLWALIYAFCHRSWHGTIFVRFPNFQAWFRAAVVIRILLAFTIYGEIITGIASVSLTEGIRGAVDLTNQGLLTGICVFIHGGLISMTILMFTAVIGLIHSFCRALFPKRKPTAA